MTHVEQWASAIVDGRVRPDVAERAHVHLAGCARCRAVVAAEREVVQRLREAPAPAPSQDLVQRLLTLGGPQGPYSSPPVHVPGAARAVAPAPWSAVATRRPTRRTAMPVAVGAVSLVSIGLLGFLLLGTTWARPAPEASLAAGAAALDAAGTNGTGEGPLLSDELDAAEREELRDRGWLCPDALPGGLRLVEARTLSAAGVPVVHATYTDGTSTISLVEQQGELPGTDVQVLERAVGPGPGGAAFEWQGVWQSGDVVVWILADASDETVARVLPALLGDG